MKGKLYAIGLGPGDLDNMTVRALNCIKQCDVLIGYTVYVEQIAGLAEGKEIIKKGMGQEIDRCKIAIEKACEGKIVGMVCSGDAGLYGMSGLLIQLINETKTDNKLDFEVVPGITAALSSASLLGAPIVEDFCTISLSDYMVQWDKIIKRVENACEGDFTIALYNPKSNARPDYLKKVIDIIMKYRKENTPVGIVRNAYRSDQSIICTTLKALDYSMVDMFCTVIIGNSSSIIIDDKIVTSRGYTL
jgi:precorrin-3B C17-methyltransferase